MSVLGPGKAKVSCCVSWVVSDAGSLLKLINSVGLENLGKDLIFERTNFFSPEVRSDVLLTFLPTIFDTRAFTSGDSALEDMFLLSKADSRFSCKTSSDTAAVPLFLFSFSANAFASLCVLNGYFLFLSGLLPASN